MQESPQQYTDRILGYLQGKQTLKVLAATPKLLAGLLKGVRRTKLVKRPSQDNWSVAEILGHLADGELVHGFRLRLILGASGTPIQGYNQDAWADYSHYAEQDPALSLQAFRLNRERTLWLLKRVPRDMWDNYGMHSERGRESITRVAEMMAGHDLNHLNQIRKILKG